MLTRIDAPALPAGRGLTVIVNPSSGPSDSDELVAQIRHALPAATILEPDDPDDVDARLREHAPGATAIGIVGGDGSVSGAAAVAADAGKPLVVVPGGTLNHFARDLGVETVAGVARAVEKGEAVAVQRGLVDGRTFLNTASFATYPQLVDAREALEHRVGKWPALAVALARVLRRENAIDVEIDGYAARIWVAFVGNGMYEPAGLAPRRRASLDDGVLDVRLVNAHGRWARTRVIGAALVGRVPRCRAFDRRVVKELRVRCLAGALRLAADGETFDGGDDVLIRLAPEPLALYSPVAG
ncbi:MAG: NAD(+)/NADH kinase [Actinobacteria bacterium]|nr:NAD(+)/NADH kinase [Actinomycetota bacterium]